MLIIKNLKIHQPGKPSNTLIEGVNVSLDSSSMKRVALIGPNGSGKTTFLKKILSKDKTISTNQEKIAYLPQHNNLPLNKTILQILQDEIQISELFKIDILLDNFQLPQNILSKKIEELSEGQILKIRLIQLLLQEPTILILDEPTNHLDQGTKEFISQFIQGFNGSILLVSHDRNFLQSTINQVWAIQPETKTLKVFTGSYKEWRDQQEVLIQKNNSSYTKIQSEIQSIQNWLRANQNHPKYKFSAIVTTKKQKLSRLQDVLQNMNLIQNPNLKLSTKISDNNYKSQLLISYSFNNHPILKNLNGKIYNNDKILLEGANGSGKTTFLNFLKAASDNVVYNKDVNIGYIKQLPEYDQNLTVQSIINTNTQLDKTNLYQKLAQLHLKHLTKSKLKHLSGGEQKRLQIAILLSEQSDLYLFDEPTNHLDIYTQEVFQEFLNKIQKPFILVSHDKFLKHDIVFSRQINLSKHG